MKMWGYHEDFDVMIGLNGCSLWDNLNKQESSYFIMKKEYIKETVDLMRPFDSNPSIYLNGGQVFLKEDETMKHYKRIGDIPIIKANSVDDLYAQDNAKIMFRIDENQMAEAENWIAEHPNENFAGFKTCPDLLEFSDPRANKAYALIRFCEAHKIDLSEVIAFGDTSNDNEMIQAAGLGVCLRNGSDDTKAVADVITEQACDDEGWADFMEKNIREWR